MLLGCYFMLLSSNRYSINLAIIQSHVVVVVVVVVVNGVDSTPVQVTIQSSTRENHKTITNPSTWFLSCYTPKNHIFTSGISSMCDKHNYLIRFDRCKKRSNFELP
jgi:hypothetical protein